MRVVESLASSKQKETMIGQPMSFVPGTVLYVVALSPLQIMATTWTAVTKSPELYNRLIGSIYLGVSRSRSGSNDFRPMTAEVTNPSRRCPGSTALISTAFDNSCYIKENKASES